MRVHELEVLAEDARFEAAARALTGWHESAENIPVYQDWCKQLGNQCTDLLLALREGDKKMAGAAYISAVDDINHIISNMYKEVQAWSTWEPTIAAWHLSMIAHSLENFEKDLIRCAMRLSFMGNTLVQQLNWVEPFKQNSVFCLDGRITTLGRFAVAGGGYADVWQGSFESRTVAIKVMRPFASTGRRLQQTKLLKRLWREYLAWSCLSHPNVLQCLGFSYNFSQDSHVCPSLISPWMSNGTVLSYLENNPDTDRLELLVGVAEGLCYLHTHKSAIAHGDLRAGNILVSDLGVPCLSDFGLSRALDEARGMTTSSELAGSLRWMSPELLHPECPGVSVYSDVWAYGMTVLEIFSGQRPYSTIKSDVAVFGQIKDGILPSRPEDRTVFQFLSDELWSVCQHCWTLQPTQRPSIADVTIQICAYRTHHLNSLKHELEMLKRQVEDQSADMRALGLELEGTNVAGVRQRELRRKDKEEIRRLKNRCQWLEREREGFRYEKELIEQLRSDHESVLIEANDLSVRNDELKTARNSDKGIIRDLNSQIQVYKRKYEQAETELHSATDKMQSHSQFEMPQSGSLSPEGSPFRKTVL